MSFNTKLAAIGLTAALVTSASATVEFKITKAYTCQVTGGKIVPYTPMIGEAYNLAVEYDLTGGPAKHNYLISFTMGSENIEYEVKSLTDGHYTYYATFQPPLDGKIPFSVQIDPKDAANGGVGATRPHPTFRVRVWEEDVVSRVPLEIDGGAAHGSFKPRPPSTSIETFDPVNVLATQSEFFSFTPGIITRLALMIGTPETGVWQKVVKDTCKLETGLGDEFLKSRPVQNPSFAGIYFWDKAVPNRKVSLIRQTTMVLSNLRVDADKLRTVTWKRMNEIQGLDYFHFYTRPQDTDIHIPGETAENVIESTDPKIAKFVTEALGDDYKSKYNPYDAARKVFRAVVRRVKYTYPKKGEPDKRGKTAVAVLDTGLGDCGGFSIALVACFRHMGIPARTSYGAWLGQDAGHCWAELYFPDHGWILADGSAANGVSEDGAFAYYFGNSNNQNARYAVARVNTFNEKDIWTAWLQGPAYPWCWGTAKVTGWESHTFLLDLDKYGAGESAEKSSAKLKIRTPRARTPGDVWLHSMPDHVIPRG
ncbi:MAG: transglutaminase domain-containing protein [Fimbriimonas ginsengisoli]|uniref:Transglutaminase domain-containing protein n=1 Tax=Fimbriimonas ginsengisoli TaxID=1005039 RepID=A0A931LUQ1_FIMGI|nr:transglutaminase domain-containing protein [Fimbriimonas ginsengisoli]